MTTPLGPLAGLRVLDLSRVLAGPYCAMMLGDLGADVIKVEQPGVGDETRRWGPPFATAPAGAATSDHANTPADERASESAAHESVSESAAHEIVSESAAHERVSESAYYLSVNRDKRGIAVDLKSPAGQDVIRRLAATADVVIENFRFGALAALGLDYEDLRRDHPELVWCAISGYGPVGPRRDHAGYDFVAQAETGVMAITGPVDGAPSKVGVAIVDITTGMYAATAILAALRARDATGQGQRVDVALFSAGLAWLANVAQNFLVAGEDSLRLGNAHRSIVPYETFRARDRAFALGVGSDKQFAALAVLLGAPEWASDPRYATNPARVQHRVALVAALNARFAARDAAAWLADLAAAGIPCGPINTVGEALRSPQAVALDSVIALAHPTLGTIETVAPPYRLSATPATVRRPPPRLGEHTDAVLRELGYDGAAIAALRASGAVG